MNPDAPKGGRVVYANLGTFDSLNPYIVKGLPVQEVRGHVVEGLMARGYDEPFTLYGLLAETVETDPARSFVTFTLNPAARFSDGKPVTPEDVVFSWQLLRDKGRPNHRTYYAKAVKVEIVGARSIRFDLSGANDRELPLILALMPVFAKHATNPDTFEQTSFTAPVGSGPYAVADVKAGESLTLKRRPDYWARDLGVTRGIHNYDEIRIDYYRDANTQFEAFKRGLYDIRVETDPGRWEQAYDFPAAREGLVVKQAIPTGVPDGMTGFVFNTRRAQFADARVREAISMLFDFKWVNQHFFFERYTRTASYFDGSALASAGQPAGARERALLAPFPDAVRADVLEGMGAARLRRVGQRPRGTARRADTVPAGRLPARRHAVAPAIERQAADVRDPRQVEGSGAARDRVCPHAARRRDRGHDPPRRRRAIRAAHPILRLRHDPVSLGRVALARQ